MFVNKLFCFALGTGLNSVPLSTDSQPWPDFCFNFYYSNEWKISGHYFGRVINFYCFGWRMFLKDCFWTDEQIFLNPEMMWPFGVGTS